MRRLRCVAASLLVAIATLPGSPPASAQSSDATRPRAGAPVIRGDARTLYRTICQGCHMAAGEGAVGAGDYPALAANPKLAAAPYVAMMVVDGRGAMPGFGELLDDRQVAEIVSYVRSSFGNQYPGTIDAEDVRSLRN